MALLGGACEQADYDRAHATGCTVDVMTLEASARSVRSFALARFALLAIVCLAVAHDAVFALENGVGAGFAAAMRDGGHDGYWPFFSVLVVVAGTVLGLRAVVRLGPPRPAGRSAPTAAPERLPGFPRHAGIWPSCPACGSCCSARWPSRSPCKRTSSTSSAMVTSSASVPSSGPSIRLPCRSSAWWPWRRRRSVLSSACGSRCSRRASGLTHAEIVLAVTPHEGRLPAGRSSLPSAFEPGRSSGSMPGEPRRCPPDQLIVRFRVLPGRRASSPALHDAGGATRSGVNQS